MIDYRTNVPVSAEDVARIFDSAGLSRPTHDLVRIKRMIDGANLIISAWNSDRLVGILRALTDECFCCYVPDIAVDEANKSNGVGRGLIDELRRKLGDEVMIVLLSVPTAVEYYPKVGFEAFPDAFIVPRKR